MRRFGFILILSAKQVSELLGVTIAIDIKGIVEDVPEIIVNLKSVRFKANDNEEKVVRIGDPADLCVCFGVSLARRKSESGQPAVAYLFRSQRFCDRLPILPA